MAERLKEMEKAAQQAWSNHELSKPIDKIDQIYLCALAGNLFSKLTRRDYPGQPLKDIYYNNCAPVVELNANHEGVKTFWDGGGISYVSFGTHPEYSGQQVGRLRWLVIGGSRLDDKGSVWQINYKFEGSTVKKQQRWVNGQWQAKCQEEGLDLVDYELVGTILGNMTETITALETLKDKQDYY